MKKNVKRTLAFLMSTVLLCTSVDLSAFAYMKDKDEYLSVDTAEGTVTEDATWEETFPNGTFAFKKDSLNVEENDGEEKKMTIYRLGGTNGRAKALVAITPAVSQLDEEGEEYVYDNAAGNQDYTVRAEDSVSSDLTIGKTLTDFTYQIKSSEKEDKMELSVEGVTGEYNRYFWHKWEDNAWKYIPDSDNEVLKVTREEYETGNYICVVESDYVLSCSAPLRETDEEQVYINNNSRTISDMQPSDGITYSEIPLDTNHPYKTTFLEVNFEEGEWVKDILVTVKDDDEHEAAELATFTIYDAEGAEFTETANRSVLSIYDDEDVIPSEMGFTAKTIRVDKSEGTATVRVNRTGGIQYVSSVEYRTVDGTAKAGTDYAASTGTAGFSCGFDYYDIQIPLIDDKKESKEDVSFGIELYDPKVGTIKDDSNTIIVSLYNTNTATEDNVATITTDSGVVDLTADNKTEDTAVTANDNEVVVEANEAPEQGELQYTPSVGEDGINSQSVDATYNWSGAGGSWTDTTDANKLSWSTKGNASISWDGDTLVFNAGKKRGSIYAHVPQLYNNYKSYYYAVDCDTEKSLYWAYNYLSATYGMIGQATGALLEPTGSYTSESGDGPMDSYLSSIQNKWGCAKWLFSFRGSEAEGNGKGAASENINLEDISADRSRSNIIYNITITRGGKGVERDRNGVIRLYSSNLTRRSLTSNPTVTLFTPDDDLIGSDTNLLNKIKPSIAIGEGGTNSSGKLYMGSEIKLSANPASSVYKLSYGKIQSSGGELLNEGNGENFSLYLSKSDESRLSTSTQYKIYAYMNRVQNLELSYDSSILADDTDEVISAKKAKILSSITYTYKGVENGSFVDKKGTIGSSNVVDNTNGNKYTASNIYNLKSINFNLDDGTVISYNNKLYSGNMDIPIADADCQSKNVVYQIITPDAVAAIKDPKVVSINEMFAYLDKNGDNTYNKGTDEIIQALYDNDVCMSQFEDDNNDISIYVKYTISPACWKVPEGKTGSETFDVYSSYVNVVTSEKEKLKLTKEQKAYRDIIHSGVNPNLYGAVTTYEMSVPVGKDSNPADSSQISDPSYKWEPQWEGNLINTFTDTQKIKLDGTWMPDGYVVADTDAEVNAYLGCLQRDDTLVLTVRPNNLINSTCMSKWQTYPAPGAQTFSQDSTENGTVPEDSDGVSSNQPDVADTDPEVSLPELEIGLGPITYMMGEEEIGFSVGVPVFSSESQNGGAAENTLTPGAAQDSINDIKDAFGSNNIFKRLKNRAKSNGSDRGFEGGDLKGKSNTASVDIAVNMTFLWKYNKSTCAYEFSSAMVALAVEASVTFQYRFQPCPIFYVYITLGMEFEASTGLEVETSVDDKGNKKNQVKFAGLIISPEFYMEAGVGVGVDLAKLEVFVKVSIGFTINYGKDKKVTCEEFVTKAAVGFRAVFLFFSYEMDLVGCETGYSQERKEEKGGSGWYFKWSAFGKEQGTTSLSIEDREINAADVSVSLPEDYSDRQQFYTSADNAGDGISSLAYDISDMPFQVSGYDSSAAAAKLATGLDTGGSYKLLTVGDKNYILYIIDRKSPDSPIDKTMLVLSEITTTSTNGSEAKGLSNPVNSDAEVPYIPVDVFTNGESSKEADKTGDLDFDAYVKNGTIYVTWTSYKTGAYDDAEALIGTANAMTTEEILADVSKKTEVKTASFVPGTDSDFTDAAKVSADISSPGHKMLPKAVNENLFFYGESENYSDDEMTSREQMYKEKAEAAAEGNNADGDGGTGDPYANANYKYSLAMDSLYGKYSKLNFAVKKTDGTYVAQSVDLDTSMKDAWVANGTRIDTISFSNIDASNFYMAYTTSETSINSEDTFTVKKMYLQKGSIDTTFGSVTLDTPVLVKTLMDAETNNALDGEYSQGTLVGEAYESPAFSNLKFLSGKLSNSGSVEIFMMFTMNGMTYVIPQSELEKMAAGTAGTITPFFERDENGNSESSVTIGADGDGNISAVYTDSVPNTVNNALYLMKYDPTENGWGKPIMLAMNHMGVYEAGISNDWDTEYTKSAYFKTEEEINQDTGVAGVSGGMDKFVFETPQIALGTPSDDNKNGTLTILTSGILTEMVEETITIGEGDDSTDYTEFVPKVSEDSNSMGGSMGLYALTYGIGKQQISEESITFDSNNFVSGAKLRGKVSFRNTGDVAIRASETEPATIRLMCGTSDGVNDTELASWSIKSSVYGGQQVVTDEIELAELPNNISDRILYFTVSEDEAYVGEDAFKHSTRDNEDGTGKIVVGDKAGVTITESSITASDDMEIITSNGVKSVVADLDMVITNGGVKDAENVKIQVERTNGKNESEEDVYVPIDLRGSLVSSNGTALTGVGNNGVFALEKSVNQDGTLISTTGIGAGESVCLKGKITLPLSCFDGNYMNLRLTILTDTEEYTKDNNSTYCQFSHVTKYKNVPSVLNLSVGNTIMFPIDIVTASTNPANIAVTEMVVGEGGNLEERDNILVNRSYNTKSGVITVRAGKEGSGVLRVADSTTGSYTDIAFYVTSGGINIDTENDYFTFDVPAGGSAWKDTDMDAQSDSAIAPYQSDICTGYKNSTITFTTYAERIDLYYYGSIRVESKNNFGYVPTNYSNTSTSVDNEYYKKTTINFGNDKLQKHVVTITILGDVAYFDKMEEHYSGSSLEDLIDSQKDTESPTIKLGKSEPIKAGDLQYGTVFEMPVYIYDNGALSSVDVSGSGADEYITAGFARATLKITENKTYTIIAVDSAGNLSKQEIEVDWFDMSATIDTVTDSWATVTAKLVDSNQNEVTEYLNGDGYLSYTAQAEDGITSVELAKYDPSTGQKTVMDSKDVSSSLPKNISDVFASKIPDNGYYLITVKTNLKHETYYIVKVSLLSSGPAVTLFKVPGKTQLFYSVGDEDNEVELSRVVIYAGRVEQTDATSIEVDGATKILDKDISGNVWYTDSLNVATTSTYTIMAMDISGKIRTSVFDDKTSLSNIMVEQDSYHLSLDKDFSPYVFEYTVVLPYGYPEDKTPVITPVKKDESQTVGEAWGDDEVTYTITKDGDTSKYTVYFERQVCTCDLDITLYDEYQTIPYDEESKTIDISKQITVTTCKIAAHENHKQENVQYSYELIDGGDFAEVSQDGELTMNRIEPGVSYDIATVRVKAYTDTAEDTKDVTYIVNNEYKINVTLDEGGDLYSDGSPLIETASESDNIDLYMNGGDILKLNAEEKTGWEFTGWTDDEGNVIESSSELSYTVLENKNIIATFLDVTAPTGEVLFTDKADGEGDDVINTPGDTETMLYSNKGFGITINSEDGESGVKSVGYQIVEKDEEFDENGEWTEYDGTFDILEDLDFKVYVRIEDNDGNVTIISSNPARVDAKGVNVALTPNFKNGQWDNIQDAKIDVVLTENVAPIKEIVYVINGTATTTEEKEFTIADLKDGKYDVSVSVTDLSGNVITSTINVLKDTSTPKIKVTGLPTRLKRNVDLKIATTPGISGIDKVTVNGIDITGQTKYNIDKNGTYVFELTNKAGSKARFVAKTNKIVIPVTGLKLNKSNVTLTKGKKFTVKGTILPSKATYKSLVFESKNTNVAKVNSKGVITAVNPGTTTIKVSSKDNPKVYKYVRVLVRFQAPKVVKTKAFSIASTQITWVGVKNAQKYKIYRSITKNGKYKKIATVKQTSYVDKNVVFGKTYYYKIVACKGNSRYDSPASTPVKAVVRLAAPTGLIVEKNLNNTLTLRWNSVDDAVSYTLFKANTANGKYVHLGETTDTYLPGILEETGNGYYKVRANFLALKLSSDLSLHTFYPVDTRMVTKLNATASKGKVTLKWSKTEKTSKYNVLRAESISGVYRKIGESKTTKYVDKSVEKGKTYYYIIAPANAKQVGNYSKAVKVKAK